MSGFVRMTFAQPRICRRHPRRASLPRSRKRSTQTTPCAAGRVIFFFTMRLHLLRPHLAERDGGFRVVENLLGGIALIGGARDGGIGSVNQSAQ